MNEIDLGDGDIDRTLENLVSICSNNGRDEDDDNTQVEYRAEAILPLHASKRVAAGTTRSQVSHIRHRSPLHTYLHGALSIIAHNPNPNLN